VWMSSVLGSSVSLVASDSFSTPGGAIKGPFYETPLLVVIALASFLGFGMQIVASLRDKLDIQMSRFEKSLNDTKASFVTPTAPIKVVEEVCVTC
nr:hypothetical protein [Tanacetum cinerariifolium]